MKTELLRRARKHFQHAMAPRHIQRHNALAWVRSIRFLREKGKWILDQPVERAS